MCRRKKIPTLDSGPNPTEGRYFSLRERSKSSDSGDDEQYEVVTTQAIVLFDHQHMFRIVKLRNKSGRLLDGVQCLECSYIEPIDSRALSRRGGAAFRGKP